MKTCLKCGYSTDNDQARFCRKCGTNFSKPESHTEEHSVTELSMNLTSDELIEKANDISYTQPVENVKNIESSPSQKTNQEQVITQKYLKENTDIDGWLAFFLFITCMGGTISAIVPLVQMNSVEYQGSTLLALSDIVFGILLCALSFYTTYSFIQRKPNAVYMGKLYVVTTFLSNLVLLLSDNYETTGLGSLAQIIRSLIWGVIWYTYLCVSNRVKEVIPKVYRKTTAKDYSITAAIYFIPIILLLAGIASLTAVREEQQEKFIQTVQLDTDEYTDGKIIFTLPEGFTSERQELEEPKFTIFILENDYVGNVTICSDYDTDMSKKNFNEYCKGWEDKTANQYTSKVICNEKRTINEKTYWYKVTRYENDGTIYWRFILLFDEATGKVAVISAYDRGYDSYIQELLKSIRFE